MKIKILIGVFGASIFVVSFLYGLFSGRAWVHLPTGGHHRRGHRRRFQWVDRHGQPIFFWGAMVAYLAAAGIIFYFAIWT